MVRPKRELRLSCVTSPPAYPGYIDRKLQRLTLFLPLSRLTVAGWLLGIAGAAAATVVTIQVTIALFEWLPPGRYPSIVILPVVVVSAAIFFGIIGLGMLLLPIFGIPLVKTSSVQASSHYPHLADIRKSLNAIYCGFGVERLAHYTDSIRIELLEPEMGSDPVITTQSIAKRIALFLNLQVGPIVVTFRADLDVAGRVEITHSDHFFVDIRSDYRDQPDCIVAILAHEIMHIFLERAGIIHSDSGTNEILTDTAAIYLGVGWPALEVSGTTIKVISDGMVQISERHLGYLTPHEYGYLLAKRTARFGERPDEWLKNRSAVAAYRQGLRRAARDVRIPPHSESGGLQRAMYAWRRKRAVRNISQGASTGYQRRYRHYGFELREALAVVFACPTCFQKLRVPLSDRPLAVWCPVCHASCNCCP